MNEERQTVTIPVRFTPNEAAHLDAIMKDGGHKKRAALVRSIVKAVIDDDLSAHAD